MRLPRKNPFEGMTDPEKAVKKYDREKKKASQLYGYYSAVKIEWLRSQFFKQFPQTP